MSPAPITTVHASILGLLYVALSLRVIRGRRRAGVSLGDRDGAPLQRAIRVHANFAEYVPLALVLMTLVEIGGGSAWLIHGAGLILLVGRLVHAHGVSQPDENYRFRVLGMALTLAAIIILALRGLASALTGAAGT